MELSPQQDVYYIDTVSPIDYFIDTVTPSAIQLNKEKTMSIELDGPLYLGSNSLQQQVDQNTEDITELQSDVSSIEGDIGSLDNLATSDKSSLVNAINETLSVLDPTQTADYIKNSKGLESGEISANASILPWVEEMSHSTFDSSKFTVTGSPIVTSDGIASGFSGSNYVKNTQTIDMTKPFVIKGQFKTGAIDGVAKYVFSFKTSGGLFLNFGFHTDNKFILYYPKSDGTGYKSINLTGVVNTNYQYEVKSTGSNLIVTINGTAYDLNTTDYVASSYTELYIGINANLNRPFNGSIDLKQFSITVDGVEVFSGNKTGIDTIKPDDYTVEGTPTISADGVASGFTTSNHLTAPSLNLSSTNELILETIFTAPTTAPIVPANSYNGRFEPLLNVGNMQIGVAFPDTGNFRIGAADIIDGTYKYSQENLSYDGSRYIIQGVFNLVNHTYYARSRKINTATWIQTTVSDAKESLVGTSSDSVYIGAFYNTNTSTITRAFLTASIDLNTIKVYSDGNLVYQPCLKIPYTESKTGSKVVDSIYRDRVNDMAEQFGYANYYTLSDTDFTLPQVELYGLIGQRTLRDSYRNGINYWELYSNRDLEQGGSCTSGVEVTFARPFVDTNYVLSVPYSAKSSTAFTPTQTGDWIAKGKGLL